jgi:alpha-L-rhamnosidase
MFFGDLRGETHVPRFTFHGFQSRGGHRLSGHARHGGHHWNIVVHSEHSIHQRLRVLRPDAEQAFQNIVWTQRANFVDLPPIVPNAMNVSDGPGMLRFMARGDL